MTTSRSFKWRSTKTLVTLLALVLLGLIAVAVFQPSNEGSPDDQARNYYANGIKLAEQHDYAKARIELRNALRLKNDMLPAWRSLAQIEEATQQWDGVIQSLQSIVNLDPSDIEARAKLAKLLVVAGRGYEALELTDTSDEAESRNAKILGLKAAIFYSLNDKIKAVGHAQAALDAEPGNADALVVLATDRMATGDVKGALQILESDAALESTDLGVQLLRLKIFEQLGDSQQVESLLRRLAELNPQESAFRKQLIKYYVDQHRESDAEKQIRAAIETKSTNPETELELVRFLYQTKGPAAAKQELIARIDAGGDVFPYQIALADFAFAQGNFADSEQLLQNLVRRASSTDQALAAQIKLAEMYSMRNMLDAAEALISEIFRKDSRNTDGLKVRASVRIARGQLEPAITDLRQALGLQPQSIELMLLLAVAYERSGSIRLAEKQYAEAVRISNFHPVVGLNYVSFLQRRGNAERAELVLTELSRRSPRNLDVLSVLAQVELARRDWTGAEAITESTLEASPDNAEARVLMGSIQLAVGAPDQALESFKLAIAKQPTSVVGYQALANFYIGEKKFDEALKVIGSGLQMQPNSMKLQLARAGALEKAQQYEVAITEYEKMLSEQPGSMIAANNLASLLSDHRSDNVGLERAKSLAASLQESEVPQFKDTVGWVSYRRGDYVAAVLLLETAAAALPNLALVHYHLAMSYIAIRQYAKASEQLKAALSLAPDSELEGKIREALKN